MVPTGAAVVAGACPSGKCDDSSRQPRKTLRDASIATMISAREARRYGRPELSALGVGQSLYVEFENDEWYVGDLRSKVSQNIFVVHFHDGDEAEIDFTVDNYCDVHLCDNATVDDEMGDDVPRSAKAAGRRRLRKLVASDGESDESDAEPKAQVTLLLMRCSALAVELGWSRFGWMALLQRKRRRCVDSDESGDDYCPDKDVNDDEMLDAQDEIAEDGMLDDDNAGDGDEPVERSR